MPCNPSALQSTSSSSSLRPRTIVEQRHVAQRLLSPLTGLPPLTLIRIAWYGGAQALPFHENCGFSTFGRHSLLAGAVSASPRSAPNGENRQAWPDTRLPAAGGRRRSFRRKVPFQYFDRLFQLRVPLLQEISPRVVDEHVRWHAEVLHVFPCGGPDAAPWRANAGLIEKCGGPGPV